MNGFKLVKWLVLGVLIASVAMVILNREWIYDHYRGMTYQPSSEMAKIRDSLGLASQGEFLFNASQPALEEKEDFNNFCQAQMTETAILGCYTAGNIYVYNIVDEELNGIRELTTAHELLHAVWARMDESEREALKPALQQTLEANKDLLEEEMAVYDATERQEELYVRAGTEIKKLPEVLEKHFAEIFTNQDRIVDYYNSYIAVFKGLEAEMDNLKNEMTSIETDLNAKMNDYETRMAQLNARIESFNACANAVGCFESEAEFYGERAILTAEQQSLGALYTEIGNLVNAYNTKVEQYNADVVRGETLNQKINSTAKPQEIE